MDLGAWGIIGSILAGAGAIYAVVVSRKKVDAEARKVEAEADSIAAATSEHLLRLVRAQLTFMEQQVDDLKKASRDSQRQVEELQNTLREYRRQVEAFAKSDIALRARVKQLEDFITHNGLPIPD